jgi:hypothetical protein
LPRRLPEGGLDLLAYNRAPVGLRRGGDPSPLRRMPDWHGMGVLIENPLVLGACGHRGQFLFESGTMLKKLRRWT